MRKLLVVVLIALLNAVVFNYESQGDMLNNTSNLAMYYSTRDVSDVIIVSPTSESNFDIEVFLSDIMEVATSSETQVGTEVFEDSSIKLFVYGERYNDREFIIDVKSPVDFYSFEETRFYTTNPASQVSEALFTYSLFYDENNAVDIDDYTPCTMYYELHPLSNYKDNYDENIEIRFIIDGPNKRDFISEISVMYPNIQEGQMSQGGLEESLVTYDQMKWTLIIFSVILVSCYYEYNIKKKEISVKLMHGYHPLLLASKIFAPIAAVSVILSELLMFGTMLLNIEFVPIMMPKFLQVSSNILLSTLVMFLIVGSLITYLISRTEVNGGIKNKQNNAQVIILFLVVKLGITLFLLPPVIHKVQDSLDYFNDYLVLNTLPSLVKDRFVLEPTVFNLRLLTEEEEKAFRNDLSKFDPYYFDDEAVLTTYYKTMIKESGFEKFRESQTGIPASIVVKDDLSNLQDLIVVNQKYLEDFPIKTYNGILDIDFEENTLYIHEDMPNQGEDIMKYCSVDCKVVTISEDYFVKNINPTSFKYNETIKNSGIMILSEDRTRYPAPKTSDFLLSPFGSKMHFSMNDFDSVISLGEKFGLSEKILQPMQTQTYIDIHRSNSLIMLERTIKDLVPLLLVLTVFTIQTVLNYVTLYKKDLTIQLIHGYSLVRRYQILFMMFLFELSVLFVFFASNLYTQIDYGSHLVEKVTTLNATIIGIVIILVEILILFIYEIFFNKNSVENLKGESDE